MNDELIRKSSVLSILEICDAHIRGKERFFDAVRSMIANLPSVNAVDLSEAVDEGYLSDWYISSVSEDDPPVWTDEHIEELCNDFYVIPKEVKK